MAGTTTKGFRYPENADAPNVAVDIQNLATDVDTYLTAGVTLTGTQTLTNKTLTAPVITDIQLADSIIVFEGATGNEFETTLTVVDPTVDNTISLPNESGVLATQDAARVISFMLGGM